MPDGKPAPPRPRRPEALISEISCKTKTYQHQCPLFPMLQYRSLPPKTISDFIIIIPRARGLASAYPIMALQNNILSPVPIAIFHRRLQIRPMVPVEVCEYPILVLQTAMTMYRGSVLLDGREGTESVPLGSDGAGGKIGDGGRRRGSRRSRYHDGGRIG